MNLCHVGVKSKWQPGELVNLDVLSREKRKTGKNLKNLNIPVLRVAHVVNTKKISRR
jgi:hypothetical protein